MENDYYMDNVVSQAASQHHRISAVHTSNTNIAALFTIAARPRCYNLSPNLPSLRKDRANSPVFVSAYIAPRA